MSDSTLVAHSQRFNCVKVDRAGLAQFATPQATSTWRPVPHVELVGTMLEQAGDFGLTPVREQYAVGRRGLALFGVIDFQNGYKHADRQMALGFRHSNDKDIALRINGGVHVFVCDNLSLSGETVAFKKHSRGLHLAEMIREGLGKFLDVFKRFNAKIEEAEQAVISDDQAKVKLFDMRYKGILPVSLFDDAAANYFRATDLNYADSTPRTTWGLHNAVTRAVKALAPASQFRTLIDVGRAFGFGSGAA